MAIIYKSTRAKQLLADNYNAALDRSLRNDFNSFTNLFHGNHLLVLNISPLTPLIPLTHAPCVYGRCFKKYVLGQISAQMPKIVYHGYEPRATRNEVALIFFNWVVWLTTSAGNVGNNST